jgi:hypothetical protein
VTSLFKNSLTGFVSEMAWLAKTIQCPAPKTGAQIAVGEFEVRRLLGF